MQPSKPNRKGPNIARLGRFLTAKGYNIGKPADTEGPMFIDSIKKYVWAEMQAWEKQNPQSPKPIKPKPAPKPPTPATPVETRLPAIIARGDTGDAVEWAQERLNIHGADLTIDGDFGNLTYNATVNFQKRHGLGVDGIIGPITQTALKSKPNEVIKPAPKPPTAATKAGLVFTRREIGLKNPRNSSNVSWTKSTRIIVHYPAMADPIRTVAQAMRALRSFQAYHLGLGWSDIGYHFAIDQMGNIYELRKRKTRGAHTGNAKKKSGDPNSGPGVCFLVTNNEKPTKAAIAAFRKLQKREGLGNNVHPHIAFDWTSCPGKHICKALGIKYQG